MDRVFRLFRSSSNPRLGPLEQRLLEALWKRGHGTVRELLEESRFDLAYTTVMTTLDRLYKKQLLDRVAEGRAFRYSPRLTQQELQQAAASEAIRQLLASGTASTLPLSFLVEAVGQHDAALLDQLLELVERKRQELRQKGKS